MSKRLSLTFYKMRGKINKMFSNQTIEKIYNEFSIAESARLNGLEGRARVCARRAAALAVRSYLIQNNYEAPKNGFLCLEIFLRLPGLPQNQKNIVKNLIASVDQNHNLTAGIDLIEEAHHLVEILDQT